MKKKLSIIGAIFLASAMSFSVSASQNIPTQNKAILSSVQKANTAKAGQLYDLYSNVTTNNKITTVAQNISNYNNPYFNLNMNLGSGWQLAVEQDIVDDGDVKLTICGFVNDSTRSAIALLLMDLPTEAGMTLDLFAQQINAEFKSSAQNVSGIQSTTINGRDFRTYTYSKDGVNVMDYVTNSGSKYYVFSFANLSSGNASNIINSVSIGGSQTPTTPIVPAPVEPAPVVPAPVTPAPVTPTPAPVTPVTPPETVDPFTPPVEPVAPVAPTEPIVPVAPTVQVDNNLLYLYNNNVYKNDNFKFYITLDENWEKPTYEVAHNFAFDADDTSIEFVSIDTVNAQNTLALATEFYKIDPSITLTQATENAKLNIPTFSPTSSNFSADKNTVLHGVPFKYFTFDTVDDNGVVFKSYMYVGIKGDSLYGFTVANVNSANKTIASKALKSIVIQ